ncbi:Deoxynucleotidyltransferase terminal-interacting protein 1 [Takifugu flavidus]|uniref:Deoxynucleotidyltransferase terminal-interacting protein 1 n=1 Tax=Takifugu flavidus TaxID=433684 RepID=A0A5C6N385_9TELE|nr:Deoxynucleotidyltransferase terminal-interacting protein 1 [Takifugu flavidus]
MGAERTEGDSLDKDGSNQREPNLNPWNLMIKHRQIHRRGRRSHMAVSYTDPQVSMDLLRAVLQPSFNDDIMAVFRKYHQFFEKAAENVKENVGDDVQTDQLIKEACRNVLEHRRREEEEQEGRRRSAGKHTGSEDQRVRGSEDQRVRGSEGQRVRGSGDQRVRGSEGQRVRGSEGQRIRGSEDQRVRAKQLFPEGEVKRMGSELIKRMRPADEDYIQSGSPIIKKRRTRPGTSATSSDRPHGPPTQVKVKADPIKREGPKWDPSRLIDGSTFVLGSRANKALGMGGTRGRIYIKHADLFKYAADAKDKQWLAERHHMRATGGKMAYLLIEEDIQDLSRSDEYKDCPDLRMDELKPFSVPPWMLEKMQRAMEAQREADL